MADHADLRRKLTAALNTTHLHPDYARALLRECRDALRPIGVTVRRVRCGCLPCYTHGPDCTCERCSRHDAAHLWLA